ncbi:MAG: hypothetical protein JRG91_14400 [Deltaproteobacteria bacterium]|nr:hypothetical protein [Deltaproteobacteria bacterium]
MRLDAARSMRGLVLLAVPAIVLFAAAASAQDPCCTEDDQLNCQDGLWCTGEETCNCWGDCDPGLPRNCDDGDWCTVDRCIDSAPVAPGAGIGVGYCEHRNICNPCELDSDCDDGDACTEDECVLGTCYNNSIICDDAEVCTTDSCDSALGCVFAWIPGCCHLDTDCDDGLFCTGVETCDTLTNSCVPGTNPCDLGLVCINTTTCNESTDTCDVAAGWCYIAGACVASGTRRPGVECEACIPATNAYDWSPAPAGWACSGDTIACTADECDGAGSCVHPVDPGWCLFGVVCIPHGTERPGLECVWCDTAVSTTTWSDKPVTAPCTDDGHTCTDDHCDGAGACEHTFTFYSPNDTCSAPDPMAMSGTGVNRNWTDTGDTYCGRDDYSSPCGGAGGADLVHSFDIPTEYETYRYRAMVGGPAGFNSVEYFYGGNTVVPGCGQSSAYINCNNDGAPACWSARTGDLAHDVNDSCWYQSPSVGGMTFPNGQNYVVVDSIGAGNSYQVKVDRVDAPDTSNCNLPLPEIQMGGTWTGRTSDATVGWGTNMPYCVQSYPFVFCYYFNIYHINHINAPWNTLNRGYIVTLDGYDTPGGFNNSMFFAVNRCDSPWYLLSCDNDTQHWVEGGFGRGSKVVTGPLPAGRLGGIIVTGYPCGSWVGGSGNYTMSVEIDDDGDGVPNSSDTSTTRYGSYRTVGGGGGAKQVPSWPWGDHGYSYYYPRNDNLSGGREVNYYYDNTLPGRTMNVRVYPRVRGDVWFGQPSQLWDARIWYRVPVSQNVYCRGWGWSWRTAGTWYVCDPYGAGSYEMVQFSGNTGRYYMAVDSRTTTPRGGWYSLEFY